MNRSQTRAMTIAIALTSWGWQIAPAWGQFGPSQGSSVKGADSQDAARRKIMESDRWRQTQRRLNEWLAVQKIYTPDEVTAIRAEFAARVAKMAPQELEVLLKDMEERLEVLTSPEAEDARQWLGQFLAVAMNPEEQLGIKRPDVLNMTASQVRLELQRLQQVRASRLQAQAAFGQKQSLRGQVSRDAQSTRQAIQAPAPNRSNWPANTPQPLNQRTQRRDPLPPPFRPPVYTVSPWGTPIIWHP